MAAQLPFLYCTQHVDPQHTDRTFYWALSQNRYRIRAVEEHIRPDGRPVYVLLSGFRQLYQELLGLPDRNTWTDDLDLQQWLQAVVHNSFVRSSSPGVLHCWYQKIISPTDLQGPMMLPAACGQDFNTLGEPDWILIRYGPIGWPMRVVNNGLTDGWPQFRDAYSVEENQRLILICERRWVFTAIVLCPHGNQIAHDWAAMTNPYFRPLYPPQDVRTAFPPSEFLTNYPLHNSGYHCIPGINHQEEFERTIQQLLNDRNVRNILVKMKARTWLIPSEDGHLNSEAFQQLITDLNITDDDYIFVSISNNSEIRIVVFASSNGAERLYAWL